MDIQQMNILEFLRLKYPKLNILYCFPIIGVDIYYIIGKTDDYILPLTGQYLSVRRGTYKRYLKYLREEVDPNDIVAEMTVKWERALDKVDESGRIPLRSLMVQDLRAKDLIIYISMVAEAVNDNKNVDDSLMSNAVPPVE